MGTGPAEGGGSALVGGKTLPMPASATITSIHRQLVRLAVLGRSLSAMRARPLPCPVEPEASQPNGGVADAGL